MHSRVDMHEPLKPSAGPLHGLRWGLDRTVSIGYGVIYDSIFAGFAPYHTLQSEILALVQAAVVEGTSRHDVRVLEIGCGPGNFSCLLAEAGFSVVGIDPYGGLIELAREKRRARRLARLAFQQADLVGGHPFWEASFDQVVSVHSLYAHPAPRRMLAEAFRVLKPGGHAIFVNHTRRHALRPTLQEIRRREGLLAAARCLLWVVPNLVFEAARQQVGPHYWSEDDFAQELGAAGFTVLEMRRTFLSGASLLVWARKDTRD
jgi:SAM-dependent methyltransferase